MPIIEELLKLKRERDWKWAEVKRLEGTLGHLEEELAREEGEI